MKKIYTKLPKLDNVKDYVSSLFSNPKGFNSKWWNCVKTYNDLECESLECNDARRSFDDLLCIVNTIYDNTSEQELAKILYDLNQNNDLLTFYCKDIKKWVWMKDSCCHHADKTRMINLYTNSENYLETKGNSKYSMRDILNLAGVENVYKIANGEKQLIL